MGALNNIQAERFCLRREYMPVNRQRYPEYRKDKKQERFPHPSTKPTLEARRVWRKQAIIYNLAVRVFL